MQLRSATRDLHASLEKRLAILERPWTRESYRDLLRRFYGYYRPLEDSWKEVPSAEAPDVAARFKSPLIREDLGELGVDPLEASEGPFCGRLPAFRSAPELWGCWYVLEGATLGGRVIVPWLRRSLGRDGDLKYRFFDPYGERTGANWRDFCADLERNASGPEDGPAAARSAAETFRTLRDWFAEDGL
jgi:heme oxygenase